MTLKHQKGDVDFKPESTDIVVSRKLEEISILGELPLNIDSFRTRHDFLQRSKVKIHKVEI